MRAGKLRGIFFFFAAHWLKWRDSLEQSLNEATQKQGRGVKTLNTELKTVLMNQTNQNLPKHTDVFTAILGISSLDSKNPK